MKNAVSGQYHVRWKREREAFSGILYSGHAEHRNQSFVDNYRPPITFGEKVSAPDHGDVMEDTSYSYI